MCRGHGGGERGESAGAFHQSVKFRKCLLIYRKPLIGEVAFFIARTIK